MYMAGIKGKGNNTFVNNLENKNILLFNIPLFCMGAVLDILISHILISREYCKDLLSQVISHGFGA